jgi:hypothetical protein
MSTDENVYAYDGIYVLSRLEYEYMYMYMHINISFVNIE